MSLVQVRVAGLCARGPGIQRLGLLCGTRENAGPRAPRHSSGTPPLRVSEPGGAAPLGGSARRRRPRALTRSGGRIFCLGCTRSVWYTVSHFTRARGSRAFFIAALFVFRSDVTEVEQARSPPTRVPGGQASGGVGSLGP